MPAEPTRAVFLSYASQDADAARRVCEALRAGGVEVWFDAEGGLEHGDEWDAKIRRQIKECVLFIPLISANTQAREEGYFRLEWDLVAERARTIASGVPFILPVVIDDTREPDALVPDRFRTVQWTRLPGGVVPPAILQRYLKLWSHRTGALKHRERERAQSAPANSDQGHPTPPRPVSVARWAGIAAAFAIVAAIVGFVVLRPKPSADTPVRPPAAEKPAAPPSEARQLVAKTWMLLNRPEMGRAELETAESLCKRAAGLDPADADVWAAWTHVHTWLVFHNFDRSPVRYEAAADCVSRAMQLDPQGYEPRLAQATYSLRCQRATQPALHEETRKLLQQLLAEKPDEPRALFALGYSLLKKSPAMKAEGFETLERLAKNPAFAAVAWMEIGWERRFRGEFAKAEEAADKSIAATPYWNNLGLKIGLALEWRVDTALALATLRRMPPAVLQEDFGIGFADLVYDWSRQQSARLTFLTSVPKEWLNSQIFVGPRAYLVGQTRLALGQKEAGERELRRALELIEQKLGQQPNDQTLLVLMARTLHLLGERSEAANVYRLAKQLGRTPIIRWTAALFEAPEAGIAELEQAYEKKLYWPTAASLRLSPDFDTLREHPRFKALQAKLEADPRTSPSTTIATPANGAAVPESRSVAVLPFANQSDDKANESFADGISEELGVVLSKVSGLRVAGWNSSLAFKGKNVPEAEIAQKLGVTHIVSGSVQKIGTQVRITARLVNAADGFSLWSESFRREARDIFAVQDEIAGLIAQNLQLKLGVESRRSRTVNPEAHRLMLEGRHFWNQRNEAGFARAEAAFRKAIDIDPTLAEAHTGLAGVYVIRAIYQQESEAVTRNSEDMRRARVAASRAVELDPALAEAHAVLAFVRMTDRDNAAAQRSFEQALQLSPNSATAHSWYGVFLLINGRIDQALERYAKAAELDPLWFINLQNLTESLFYAGRHEEALRVSDRATTLRSDPFIPHVGLRAQILFALGRRDEAVQLARTLRSNPAADTRWIADAAAIRLLNLSGQTSEAQAYAAEVLERLEPRSATRAQVLAALGRYREALGYLGQARAAELRFIFYEPLWDPWRSDPGFAAAIAQLVCKEEYQTARESLARLKKQTDARK